MIEFDVLKVTHEISKINPNKLFDGELYVENEVLALISYHYDFDAKIIKFLEDEDHLVHICRYMDNHIKTLQRLIIQIPPSIGLGGVIAY